jgi:hypothetical protein
MDIAEAPIGHSAGDMSGQFPHKESFSKKALSEGPERL